ncbi:MAG TPA: apolipoprotein N-acyltransferase [Gemmatimonadaceae bacterium]|nr:apolipoprotein N-acyltransferase [Gemmatimonadaceae bacterium]
MRPRVLWPLRRDEALAVLASAVLFTLSFPPFPFVVPVFFCLVPIGLAVARIADGESGVRAAARLGFWFGLAAYAMSVYWIASALKLFTSLAYLGFAATIVAAGVLISVGIVGMFCLRRLSRWPMAIVLPVGWVGFEVMMANLPDIAFPWLPLGLATAWQPLLAQVADVSGVRGVSFIIAAINGLFIDAWLLRADRRAVAMRAAAAIAIVLAMLGYGAWRLATIETRVVGRVAIVQPNIPQLDKWMDEHRDRIVSIVAEETRKVPALGQADLIVWPEATFTDFIQYRPAWLDTVAALVHETGAPIIFGTPDLDWRGENDYDYYNAAMITQPDGRVTQPAYRKRDLVPIVERVPFVNPRWFSRLRYFGGFSRGNMVLFESPVGTLGILICYESVFAGRSREFRRNGAALLVNITNDAWFGRSLAPYHHEAHLALRAIENRAGVIRSANTGISSYIDPLGRFHGRTPLFESAVRLFDAETTDVVSPYLRFGDWVGTIAALAALLAILVLAVGRGRAP